MAPDNQIDELFNERLREYRSPVPANLWDRIIQKKEKDRRLFIFFFRLFGIFILTLGFAGGYFIFQHQNKDIIARKNKTAINHTPPFADTGHAMLSNLNRNLPLSNAVSGTNTEKNRKVKLSEGYSNASEKAGFSAKPKGSFYRIEQESDSSSPPADAAAIDSNEKRENKVIPETKPFLKCTAADSLKNAGLKKPPKEKAPNGSHWYLDAYASPDLPIVSGPKSGQMELSYTAGIKLNRSFGKHFSARIGIQFSQINYKDGDTLGFTDSKHLRSFDFPVFAGYSVGNEKFRATLNAGVVLNLYSRLQGGYSPNYFKMNTGVSFYLGVNFDKNINQRISIFVEPYYRYRLTPITISSVDFNKFIDVAGLSIGIRYHFKK